MTVTVEDAIKILVKTINQYCPEVKLKEMTIEDLEAMVQEYAACYWKYHPEDSRQMKIALLRKAHTILVKYGFKKEGVWNLFLN